MGAGVGALLESFFFALGPYFLSKGSAGVTLTFGFRPPSSISSMFGSWLKSFHSSVRKKMLIGVAAVRWSLWLTRNDVVFRITTPNFFCSGV
jgi:hypothetical protein